ncbi:hypothetical protein COLO4_07188 [Corchorus olitorius]|uniref:Uncharacterized protein n=1 Tax=Corchorus olitorius TaxID=93759 RepID=A0A1R3KKJ9_9ROSI|nr:hypothetical protein COLO4_07188 [Corchorus olitorius]
MELDGEDNSYAAHLNESGLSLHQLWIASLPQLLALPEGFVLKSAKTLQHLHIEDCQRLKTIPKWLDVLTSLDNLEIFNCQSLSCQPGITPFTVLTKAKIEEVWVDENAYDNSEAAILSSPSVVAGPSNFAPPLPPPPPPKSKDSGSSHNLVQPRIVRFLGVMVEPAPAFAVMVGNDDSLKCEGLHSLFKLTRCSSAPTRDFRLLARYSLPFPPTPLIFLDFPVVGHLLLACPLLASIPTHSPGFPRFPCGGHLLPFFFVNRSASSTFELSPFFFLTLDPLSLLSFEFSSLCCSVEKRHQRLHPFRWVSSAVSAG